MPLFGIRVLAGEESPGGAAAAAFQRGAGQAFGMAAEASQVAARQAATQAQQIRNQFLEESLSNELEQAQLQTQFQSDTLGARVAGEIDQARESNARANRQELSARYDDLTLPDRVAAANTGRLATEFNYTRALTQAEREDEIWRNTAPTRELDWQTGRIDARRRKREAKDALDLADLGSELQELELRGRVLDAVSAVEIPELIGSDPQALLDMVGPRYRSMAERAMGRDDLGLAEKGAIIGDLVEMSRRDIYSGTQGRANFSLEEYESLLDSDPLGGVPERGLLDDVMRYMDPDTGSINQAILTLDAMKRAAKRRISTADRLNGSRTKAQSYLDRIANPKEGQAEIQVKEGYDEEFMEAGSWLQSRLSILQKRVESRDFNMLPEEFAAWEYDTYIALDGIDPQMTRRLLDHVQSGAVIPTPLRGGGGEEPMPGSLLPTIEPAPEDPNARVQGRRPIQNAFGSPAPIED